MAERLTPNAIGAVMAGDVDLKPLVQALDIVRMMAFGGNQERYRVTISDGVRSHHAVLASQLNDLAKGGHLRRGSVLQLIDYTCSSVQGRRFIMVLNMEIISVSCEVIGHPKPFADSKASTSAEAGTGINNKQTSDVACMPSLENSADAVKLKSPTSNLCSKPGVQPSYRPPPAYTNRGPIMKNEAPARIIPVAALNPYQGRWAIKARVTAKGDIRRYNNARGDGKVFSFDLLDADGGEIRATCFNSIVDRFYELIEVGRVYALSKGSIKPAQRNFNHLNNDWEIFLDSTSKVDRCPDEDVSIPQQNFSFRPINEIENMENASVVDVIGVLVSVGQCVTILRKNGMETLRRILTLKDMSGRSVELTLWGNFCNKEGREMQDLYDSGLHPVLAVKAGRVNDFSGKTIGTISTTQLFIDPDIPESQKLKDWFEREGKNGASQSISRDVMPLYQNEIRKNVSQIKDEGLGRMGKPDWVTIKAALSYIKVDTFCYTACPLMAGDRQCNRKVTKTTVGGWHCERCNQDFLECDYRYILQAQVQDHTGVTWVTAFQESGEQILGCSAKELYLLKYEKEDDTRFGEIIKNALFRQYLFKLKIKEEIYGDEQQTKATVVKSEKLNFSAETKHLLSLLQKNE
ncbi:replication protein A 70 kDa DNA-binding subunit A [Nymphaea colorata]|nr:replication protein A 70 kDa DNA-binding subunit A [Nymphaea colorata]